MAAPALSHTPDDQGKDRGTVPWDARPDWTRQALRERLGPAVTEYHNRPGHTPPMPWPMTWHEWRLWRAAGYPDWTPPREDTP